MLARSARSLLGRAPTASTSSSSCLASSPSLPPCRLASSASDTSKAAAQMKRFWKVVSLHSEPSSHHEVRLDNRSLRTPEGQLLKVPWSNRLLATLVVHEWNEQSKVIKSHALPMTSLVARSIDGFSSSATRSQAIDDMLKYANTDTVCFHESDPKALVRLQSEHWDPLLDWVSERFGTRPSVAFDTLSNSQPPQLIEALKAHLHELSPLELAALEKSLHLTKSIFLSLALLHGRLSVAEAMDAAWVETSAQIETWGEVEDSHDVAWAELGRELGAVRVAAVRAAAGSGESR